MLVVAGVALAGAWLFVYAVARRGRSGLAEVIRRHDLLPKLAPFAPLFGALEAVVGTGIVVGWLTGSGWLLRPLAVTGAVWYAVLAAYVAVLLRRRGRVPCGCLDDESPASPAKVARAGLLAAALAGLAWGPPAPRLIERILYAGLAVFVAALFIMVEKVAELRPFSG